MSPLCPGLNRLPRVARTILYQNRRLCSHHKPLPAQYDHHGPNSATNRKVEKKELPEELMRNVVRLTCKSTAESGVCDVHVVGTCHVSQASANQVQAIVKFLKPEVVFLELCSSRLAIFSTKSLKIPTTEEMVDMLLEKKHNLFGILLSWYYAEVGAKLGVLPGSEFKIAYEEASKYGGKVILGDRPAKITLQRTWGNMSLWHKTKLLYTLLGSGSLLAGKLNKTMTYQMIWGKMPLWLKIKVSLTSLFVAIPSADELKEMLKKLEDSDTINLYIQEISKKFPTLVETLVYERDRYMSSKLLEVAKDHNSVVTVVGMGHLQGIKKNWGQPVSLAELLEVPK